LLERALEKKERSRLGAHYTPRSYVERLVCPVVMEPLRQQWDEVELELRRLLETAEGKEPTVKQKEKAEQEIQGFLADLRRVKILDPACGTGNFLYVTLDLLKGLEQEAIARLVDVTGSMQIDLNQVNPAQFLGIEINPRAAAIAELVIWIGYLQWYFKRYGNATPPEPVLQAFGNIECRDAVLAYDGREPDVDVKTGDVRTRWGGRMMKHVVTGEEVPDPSDQVVIYRYFNARAAEWPDADYIVSNPPFIGNSRMRESLGDGYTEALRKAYIVVPDTIDFVMYWWHKAAEIAVHSKKTTRFGFISTNTIRQIRQRKVIDYYLSNKKQVSLVFAIPDHPWTDGDAAVTIAMTAAEVSSKTNSNQLAQIGQLVSGEDGQTPEDKASSISVQYQRVDQIFSDLSFGVDTTKSFSLKSNSSMTSKGFELGSQGFLVNKNDKNLISSEIVHPFITGRDLAQIPEERYVIDANHLSEEELEVEYPSIYQWLLENVKPTRQINNDLRLRREWWRYRRSNDIMRDGTKDLEKYIITPRTAKHRCFTLRDKTTLPESEIRE
jgi:hypothetical protein